jgi:HEAT repeat protein
VITLLTWVSIGLAAAGSLLICVLALRRIVIAGAERRIPAVEAGLTPLALALLEGETGDLRHLDPDDGRILAALLAGYSQRVRGLETARIGEFFERHGVLDREVVQLGSRRAWKRATAAFALGDMASSRAIPPLLDTLDDREPGVRAAAARSLGRLGAIEAVEPIVYALAKGRLPRSVAGQALLAIGPDALPTLRGLEEAPDPNARAFAVELVGLLGDASDDLSVLERLRDTSAEVRAKAARALGRLGAEEAAAALTAALDDRIVFVRVSAAHALAAVGDPDAVPALLRIAREDEFDAARAAASAAARLDPDAVRSAAAHPVAGPHLREAADLVEVHG